MGDYTQAESLLQQTVALRKEALGENHPDYATSLHNLGRFYHIIEDYDRAEPLYLQALAIRKQKLGEKHPYYAQTLDKLAWLYQAKGDYARAEPLYLKALEARKASLGEKHRYDATILTNQALLYHAMGYYDKADAIFHKSLEWTKKQVGEQNPEYARTLHHLAMLQFAGKKYAEAEELGRQPVDISRKLLERCSGVQSERQQLAMMQTSRFYLDGYLTIASEAKVAPERVYAQILAGKGAVLTRQRRLRRAAQPSRAGRRIRPTKPYSRPPGPLALAVPDPKQQAAFRRQIEELAEEKERLESDLAGRSAAFQKDREAARLAPVSLQAALPGGVALIDFLEYTHRSPPVQGKGPWKPQRRLVAFVVRSDAIHQFHLGPVQPMAEAIDRWRASYGAGRMPPVGTADPAAELLKYRVATFGAFPEGGEGRAGIAGRPAAWLAFRRPARRREWDFPRPRILLCHHPRSATDAKHAGTSEGIAVSALGRRHRLRRRQGRRSRRSSRWFAARAVVQTAARHGERGQRPVYPLSEELPGVAPPKLLSESEATEASGPDRRAVVIWFVHLATHGFFAAASEKNSAGSGEPAGFAAGWNSAENRCSSAEPRAVVGSGVRRRQPAGSTAGRDDPDGA